MAKRTDHKPPWERERPAQRPKTLTAPERREAKARASKAGRTYPNLVDNMAVVNARKPRKASTRTSSAKTGSATRTTKRPARKAAKTQ